MRGVFDDDEELEEKKAGNDTELTLGTGTLVLLLCGLVLVCGLCFGLGYAVGHRAVQPQQASDATHPAMAAAGSVPKPAASTSPAEPAVPTPAAADQSQSAAAGAGSEGEAQPANPAAPAAPSTPPPAVRPALPQADNAQPAPAPAARPVQNVPVQSAAPMPAANSLWVQIAAVSHDEDAEVLTSALRRRGYTVTARREPGDSLIHVRIGPFATRNEAAQWRMRLLNDGYNAMIQP